MESNVKYTKNIPRQDSVFIEMKIEIEEHVISEFCQNDSGFGSCNSDAEIKREGGCNLASKSHFISELYLDDNTYHRHDGFQDIGKFLEASLTNIEPSFYDMGREGEQLNNNLKDLEKSTGITMRNNKQTGSKCTKEFSNRQKKENLELLDTKEELFVYLLKQDLRELQETFRKKPSYSERGEETKSRRHLQNNVNKSRGFACRSCRFRCDTKYLFMVHVVENHDDVAQQKKLLPSRYLSPGNSPDSVWFKCTDCSYITSRKQSLERHLSTHKSIEAVAQMFRCASCPFVSKIKGSLERHVMKHRPVKSHKCPHCKFETIYKNYMCKHIRTIHNTRKVETFKCRMCDFQAKEKNVLIRHLLTHKTPVMIKCDLCPYQTKHRNVLKKHRKTHESCKSKEELVKFQCDRCEYRAITKDLLGIHCRVMHSNPDGIIWRWCEECGFQTKYQRNLKRHLLLHGKPEDVNVFKCAKCPFSTTTKQQLVSHVAKHMNVYMECEKCDFRTKFRSSLYKHKKTQHPA